MVVLRVTSFPIYSLYLCLHVSPAVVRFKFILLRGYTMKATRTVVDDEVVSVTVSNLGPSTAASHYVRRLLGKLG